MDYDRKKMIQCVVDALSFSYQKGGDRLAEGPNSCECQKWKRNNVEDTWERDFNSNPNSWNCVV